MAGCAVGGLVDAVGRNQHHIPGLDFVERIFNQIVAFPAFQIIDFKPAVIMIVKNLCPAGNG